MGTKYLVLDVSFPDISQNFIVQGLKEKKAGLYICTLP